MTELLIKDYLHLLNQEARHGEDAANAILAVEPPRWPDLLRERPDWVRFGTLDRLLAIAQEDLYRAPQRSLAIAQLVIAQMDAIPRVFPDDFLFVQLRGLAFKAMAGALYSLREYDKAEVAAEAAVTAFAENPALAIDRANALFVQAKIWQEQKRTDAAIEALRAAVSVYAEYGDAQHYLWTIEFQAIIEFDQQHYEEAYETFTIAIEEARRIHDLQSEARSLNNRGQCEMYLGATLEATEDLSRAFTAFSTLGMHAAGLESLWGIAKLAQTRGALPDARAAFEGVYASFLRLGMVARAMSVLVELSAVIAQLEGDLPAARLLCGRFVQAIGPYPVEESIRVAANYLARATATAETTTDFVAAVAPVRAFCREGSFSAVFVPPDAMTA